MELSGDALVTLGSLIVIVWKFLGISKRLDSMNGKVDNAEDKAAAAEDKAGALKLDLVENYHSKKAFNAICVERRDACPARKEDQV